MIKKFQTQASKKKAFLAKYSKKSIEPPPMRTISKFSL